MAYTTINKPSQYFNTLLYTGNGSARTITGVGFQPDWVWVKDRTSANSHYLYDILRGNNLNIFSNDTSAEVNITTGQNGGGVGSQASDGFTIVAGVVNTNNVNTNTNLYASWNWLANGAGVSNTAGSITSTVSANPTAGFSIVSWTGTGNNSDQTLGTGLSTALDLVIAKARDSGGGTDQWLVYVNGVTDAQDNCLLLNSSNTLTTGASGGTPNRGSTAGQLKLLAGTGNNQNLNANTLKYIAYCFHNVKGYSKFGSYTGNGSANGTFVYTGFKPALVVIKNTTHANNWIMLDNKRGPYNLQSTTLYPNTNDVETSTTTNFGMDFLSNGMKMRTSGDYNTNSNNSSGDIYIYMCFAENPFVSSTLIPTTAR